MAETITICLATAGALILASAGSLLAQTAPQVFEKNCVGCHGAAQMSELDLRNREAMLRGGNRGPAIVPGNAEASLIYRAVSGTAEFKMPPGKQALSADEIGIIRDWIQQGAAWSEAGPHTTPAWWSFQKPKRPPVPVLKNGSPRNPIDSFVLAKLEELGLR